jgi:hypothetical protein
MSKFEHSFLIVLIVLNAGAVITNYMIDNKSAAIWAGIATLWTFNYYMLKRRVS